MVREKFSLNPFRPNHSKFCEVREVSRGRFTLSATHYNVHRQWGFGKDHFSSGRETWSNYRVNLGFIELELTIERK